MSFIVEDGSGKKSATSYATVAFFKAYCADRAMSIVGWSDEAIQALLVKATDYIDTRWGLKFLGARYWTDLSSRSVFTLTAQPADGNTIAIDGDIYTFRTIPALDTEIEIGDTLRETLENIGEVIPMGGEDDVVEGFLLPDPDTSSLVVFMTRDGVSTTDACANGSWDVAASAGESAHQQPLEFPRSGLLDRDGNTVEGIPDRLKEATCEYAFRAYTAALAPDPTIDSTVISQSTSVGPISKSVTYAGGAVMNMIKPYPAADRLLQEYVRPSGIVRS